MENGLEETRMEIRRQEDLTRVYLNNDVGIDQNGGWGN